MEFFLVFLMAVLTAVVIVRTGAFSPASIVCAFSTLSIAVFCYVVYGAGKETLAQSGGLSFEIGDYHEQAATVIEIYFLLVAVIAAATLGLSKFGQSKPSAGASENTGDYVLALMDRFLFSSAMPLIAGGLLGITILSLLLSAVGLANSPLVQVVNMGLGPGTVVYVSLLIYSWGKQSKLVIGMLLTLCLYNFVFMLAFYSRFTALAWVVATGLIASKRIAAGKSPFSVSVFGCAFLSIWMFLYALQGRGSRGALGLAIFNWPVITRHLFGITFNETTFATVATNIFAGPMILAECLGNSATVSYDPRYMYLSFSPLPAFLDGWRNVIDMEVRVNANTPFNALAEVYYFGWPYIILLAIILTICIRVLTRIYLKVGGAGGLLLTSPCVYSLLCLHQYQLRNSLRVLYFTTLAVYFLSNYLSKKARENGSASRPSPQAPLRARRVMRPAGLPPRVLPPRVLPPRVLPPRVLPRDKTV